MNSEGLEQVLADIAGHEEVRDYRRRSPTDYQYEVATAAGRTQVVTVRLLPDGLHVLAFSVFGRVPHDAEVLTRLLEENMDGCYSRIAAVQGTLGQVHRYALEELEPAEFMMAVREVASFADHYEEKYFGVDQF